MEHFLKLVPFLKMPSDTEQRRLTLERLAMTAEIVIGLIAFAFFAPRFEGDVPLFMLLLALTLLAERMPIYIYGDSVITVSFVFTLAIIGMFGAPGVAIVAPAEAVARRVGHPFNIRLIRSAFRGVIVYTAAAEAYALFAPVAPASVGLRMIPAGLVATGVTYGLSAFLVTLTATLRSGQHWLSVWANHRWVALHYLAFGIVGLGFLAAYISLGYWGLLAYLTPAFVLRLSIKQYVDKTAENVEKLKEQNAALEKANVEIRKVSDELRVTYNATLEALVSALEARDHETKGHSVRVARYMLNIARAMGVRPGTQDWLDVQHGALLHDVGKIGVRDSILLKPGKLTAEEWELMRLHPQIGYNILREVKFLSGAAEIVLAHHEWWDGNGYPHGLREDEIPLGSRIFAVVDTFDSMTSDRPYRRALSPEEALSEILRCRGSQFDPRVVEAFLDIYEAWVIEREGLLKATAIKPAA